MPVSNTASLLILTFVAYLFHHVSALSGEKLIGGQIASEGSFKYQVAITARQNYTIDVAVVCSGGIIAPTLILTAAQCFFNHSRGLKEFSFAVIVNSTDLTKPFGLTINITYIYIPDFHMTRYFTFSTNDIAIVQVAADLLHLPHCNLQSLKVPTIYGLPYSRKVAVVAGYGDHWIILEQNHINRQYIRIDGRSDYKLNYANVSILTDTQCYRRFFPRVRLPVDNLMCGVMKTDFFGQHWGICENDFGAPLVFNNTIVGIASERTLDCNDTGTGALYIKTSSFTFFLRQVLQYAAYGTEMENVLVYNNRVHVL